MTKTVKIYDLPDNSACLFNNTISPDEYVGPYLISLPTESSHKVRK